MVTFCMILQWFWLFWSELNCHRKPAPLTSFVNSTTTFESETITSNLPCLSELLSHSQFFKQKQPLALHSPTPTFDTKQLAMWNIFPWNFSFAVFLDFSRIFPSAQFLPPTIKNILISSRLHRCTTDGKSCRHESASLLMRCKWFSLMFVLVFFWFRGQTKRFNDRRSPSCRAHTGLLLKHKIPLITRVFNVDLIAAELSKFSWRTSSTNNPLNFGFKLLIKIIVLWAQQNKQQHQQLKCLWKLFH